MKKTILFLLTIAVGCARAAPPPPPPFTPDDEAAIRALVAEWSRLIVADDIDAAYALMTDDYVEARATPIVGPEQARALFRGFGIVYRSIDETVRRVEGVGGLAWVWTEFDARYTADGGGRRQHGNSVRVVRKLPDGRWRFAASAFQASSVPDSIGA